MAAEKQDFKLYRGTTALLRFVMMTNGSVSGWTTRLSVRIHDTDPDPLVLDVAGSIEDQGSSSTPGIFNVTITKAQTLTLVPRKYTYSLERVDAGVEDLLAIGTITVKLDVRNSA